MVGPGKDAMLSHDFELFDFGPGRGGFDGPGRGGFGIVGGILGTLLWIALITLAVVAIVYLVRRLRAEPPARLAAVPVPSAAVDSATPAAGSMRPARAVLDERFARGEIDAEEYTSRRTLLDGDV